ncbi:DNA helicase/exodeoxyribonuclease V, subunit A [Poseidonocella pacifica]|uniref:DNA 3'-5' helicase n=1 Tax=Poseidonocella pacifica TaxID=871651 RepID=A0A1I0XV87_9RHOB|nr:double-strand break repair helicase AddA [Poseidonocella pacifica]SFB04577.1 DNA helicase/exodeoxyribonuclease V, subunit A [Poseidonocella pacifica]
MSPRDDATERQVRAAHPARSTWLSANAGSGKTRVLTDRVARLLLTGADPRHILCLTYTKAAASEMQNRLFRRLGAWAMLPDAELRTALDELGADADASPETLRRARTLFASAIETPGGLKIQTIHSFCSALLRRFPLEAGVSPDFTEIEDRAADLLRGQVLDDMAAGPDVSLLKGIAAYIGDEQIAALISEIIRNRAAFQADLGESAIFAALDLREGSAPQDALSIAFDGSEKYLAQAILGICAEQTKTYKEFAADLANLDLEAPGWPEFEGVCDLFLYKSGETAGESKSRNFPQANHKKAVEAFAPIIDELHAFMDRVAEAKRFLGAVNAAQKTLALHRFAKAFLQRYEAAKLARGWLDFDDLILKARGLVTDPRLAQWVLYRLDGGIDHILVDEAQDTSPLQWDVVKRLTEEFTSGAGARPEAIRTLFVVGDVKQSIYSFQGADPDAFSEMRNRFGQRFEEVDHPFQVLELQHSFRSSPAILEAVDHTFATPRDAGLGQSSDHRAFHAQMPGRVDLWPVVEPPETPEDGPWYAPIDQPAQNDAAVMLAQRIAGEIRRMIDEETLPAHGGARRAVRAGDILILVQRRSPLFHEIIRACKVEGLDVAGADRLKVGSELAVRDLAALLSFLALPEDDLSLATALRSPIFGWSEQEVFDLAARRGPKFLWEELRRRQAEFPQTMEVIQDLRREADFLRPYELIERVLTRHDGRRRILARLGVEAEDGIDALLSQALGYERTEVPSLTGFLTWMQTDDLEIKRQMDSAGDKIRVMTVHGAKGLEAPIVILPDTAVRRARQGDALLEIDQNVFWRVPAPEMPEVYRESSERLRARDEAERMRLLYVAMTRAESWLIVAAAGNVGSEEQSWYGCVEAGLDSLGTPAYEFAFGTGRRHQTGDWSRPDSVLAPPPVSPLPNLPDWATHRAAPAKPLPEPVTPSALGGAKALPGEAGLDEETAKRRGTQIHLLLEHLPGLPARDLEAIAARLLPNADPAEREAALSATSALLDTPNLRAVFAPETLAEVPVSVMIGGVRIHGVIDRLIVEETRVLAIDFKTNRVVPRRPEECPEGLLRQMGAYAGALGQIYPDRRVETAILWTETHELMTLPHDLVTAAFTRAELP